MAVTERSEFFLTGSLFAALALLLLAAPSSPVETKTTCQRVPAPNGGHWTVKTTVTFKAKRTPLKRACSSVVDSATTVSPQTTTEARIESKEYTPYKIVKETFEDNQTTTEARIINEDFSRYNIIDDSEEYVQAPIENKISSEEFYRYNVAVDNEEEGQTALESSASPLTSPPPTVRSDYAYYDGVGYYKLHRTLKTWPEAKLTCEEEGGHLAIINSKEEENAIVGLLKAYVMMYENVYIGFHDMDNEGQFVTVLGDPLESVGYVNWALGQPSDSKGDQNCGAVVGSGWINDYFCDEKLYFLCELPLL